MKARMLSILRKDIGTRPVLASITICIAVLGFSAVMDLMIWLTTGFMIPCWSVSGFCVGLIALFVALYHYVDKEERMRVEEENEDQNWDKPDNWLDDPTYEKTDKKKQKC